MHLDYARRDEAIAAIGRSVGERLPIGDEWHVVAIVDGEVIGGVMRKGREVHLGITRPVFLRGLIRQYMRGDEVTTVRASHAVGRRFVERLGFVQTGESGEVIRYELKGLNHVRTA